jgi:hypothetical protein
MEGRLYSRNRSRRHQTVAGLRSTRHRSKSARAGRDRTGRPLLQPSASIGRFQGRGPSLQRQAATKIRRTLKQIIWGETGTAIFVSGVKMPLTLYASMNHCSLSSARSGGIAARASRHRASPPRRAKGRWSAIRQAIQICAQPARQNLDTSPRSPSCRRASSKPLPMAAHRPISPSPCLPVRSRDTSAHHERRTGSHLSSNPVSDSKASRCRRFRNARQRPGAEMRRKRPFAAMFCTEQTRHRPTAPNASFVAG